MSDSFKLKGVFLIWQHGWVVLCCSQSAKLLCIWPGLYWDMWSLSGRQTTLVCYQPPVATQPGCPFVGRHTGSVSTGNDFCHLYERISEFCMTVVTGASQCQSYAGLFGFSPWWTLAGSKHCKRDEFLHNRPCCLCFIFFYHFLSICHACTWCLHVC